jgi:hypothetical protein
VRQALARGQAVVEASLGIFVFVTILVFGIHFAEIGHISLKVQEAANAAIWDATSQQMHDVTAHSWNEYTTAVSFAQTQANNRYQDFDALRSGRTTITQVMTQTTNMQINCQPLGNGNPLRPAAPDALAAGAYPGGGSGISCSARAQVSAVNIPRNFLDGNLSEVRHYRPLTIPICAVGRPNRGNCPGRVMMLLDDWGYSGQQEARECALAWEGGTTCENQGYYDQVKSAYDATPADMMGAASRLASVVAGSSPIDEDFFYMSFRGRESSEGPYTETVRSSHGDLLWETTPFNRPTNSLYDDPSRTNCWLGNPCR